uniref:Cytochrome p450 n=1 Tax=Croton stellatopilosus TaxID=431156 RepID=A0A3G2CJW9_9ROSI|nr:cytochrome p450 [Croton stellatopilosus]
MEISSNIQTVLHFLALLSLFGIWRKLAKTKKIQVPEPPGSLPFIGHLHLLGVQKPACKILASIADKSGPFFALRLGSKRLLVVSSWEIAKQCLSENDRVFATRARIAAGKHMGYNDAVFALAPYGEYWRDVRKLVTLQLLSHNRLEALKHVRHSEIDLLLKQLYSGDQEKVINLSKLLEEFTFNINLRMLVGKRYCSESFEDENSEAWRYKKAIEEAIFLSGCFVLSDAIPWLEWFDYEGYIGRMKRVGKEADSLIGKWLEEHLMNKNGDNENDFMNIMLSHLQGDAKSMYGHSRDTIIKATTLNLTLTGAGSTSVTLTWAISLLLNNPHVLKTAQEELNTYVGKSKWVQESDIPNLKYLQAIVKETLRLYPPGPVTGIREAMQDCNINGYYIPKGSRLLINIWKLQRDPRVWNNPDEFLPTRFLTTHADIDLKGQNLEFIPFGSGRRGCPAMNYGLHIVHLTVAKLIQGFDLSTVGNEGIDMKEGLGLALPKMNPLQVIIKPRLGLELYQCLN